MKVVYVAGPYRDQRGQYWVGRNIEAAREIAATLWAEGFAVLCPHANTAHFDGVAPETAFLEGDLEMLRRCDAMVLTPDWEHSSGARNERTLGEELGLEIHVWPGRPRP